jgi:hypothetical protein
MKKIEQIASKPIWKSKTMWLGLATTCLAGFEFWRDNTVSPNVIAVLGILIMGLRYMTTKPLSLK